jgi:hypothetical protein
MTTNTKFRARIRPYNPRRGLNMRTYVLLGRTYKVDGGWYDVDARTAAYLAEIRNGDHEDAPFAFEIQEYDPAQEPARPAAAPTSRPRVQRNDLRSADLTPPSLLAPPPPPPSSEDDEGEGGDEGEGEDAAGESEAAPAPAPPPVATPALPRGPSIPGAPRGGGNGGQRRR